MEEKRVNYDYNRLNDSIYDDEKIHVKDFVIGALVGGIVGVATALLLTPKTGSEMRNDVAVQAVTLKDKSIELSGTAKEKTAQLSTQLKEQSSSIVEKVKAKTAKQPPVLDGTASSEGEEPLPLDKMVDEEVLAAESPDPDSVNTDPDIAPNSTRHTDVE
ncbi:YtxH domain-containing protein [Solibacillus sp. FSL W7-1464]|uniref:YtxH domain-containing protein n=1 Tax=Solibacillus sp. FSL W7-1464 TaxID=2921706 RepID=UPI0030F61296